MPILRPRRVLLVLAALLAGPTGGAFADDEAPPSEGRKLFLKLQCIRCHSGTKEEKGPNLEGLFGKKEKLRGGGTVTVDEAYVAESIRKPKVKVVDGWEAIMPAYDKGNVTEDELKALVAYIRSLKPGDTQEPKEERPKGPTPAPGR